MVPDLYKTASQQFGIVVFGKSTWLGLGHWGLVHSGKRRSVKGVTNNLLYDPIFANGHRSNYL